MPSVTAVRRAGSAAVMRGYNDECAERRGNSVQAVAAEAEAEHGADEVEQDRAADADDHRGNNAVAGEAGTFRGVADDARDHDGAEESEKHGQSPSRSSREQSGCWRGVRQTAKFTGLLRVSSYGHDRHSAE